MPDQRKRCRHCNEIKDASAFPRNVKASDGLDSWCQRCHTEASKRSAKRRKLGLTPTPPKRKPRKPRPTVAERWQRHTLVTDGCWLWQGRKLPFGYGTISVDKQTKLAHRVGYELHVGPIPDTHHVHHLCGNPSCVRPDHLALVERIEHERMHARLAAALRAS